MKILTLNNPPPCIQYSSIEDHTFPVEIKKKEVGEVEDVDNDDEEPEWSGITLTEQEYLAWYVFTPELVSEIKAWCQFQEDHFSKDEARWDQEANGETFRIQGQSIVVKMQKELDDHKHNHGNVAVVLNVRPLKTVKLMNEYTADFPLWRENGPGGPMCPEALPISQELRTRLFEWARVFLDYFHWDGGWMLDKALEDGKDICDSISNHRQQGRELQMALTEELESDKSTYWRVYLDYWENSNYPIRAKNESV